MDGKAVFKITDKVTHDGNNGEVWKVSDYAVHVFWNEGTYKGCYQCFYFEPTHHKQTHIDELQKAKVNG